MDVMIRAANITRHCPSVSRRESESLFDQKGGTIWLTGLSSSGKSSTAFTLERRLLWSGFFAYVLDGDNVRHGLNKDLGFSAREREENIGRVAEVAKLFADSGLMAIASFISPYRRERDLARRIHEDSGLYFAEVFVDTPIDVCESRDPKGLYAKARRGDLLEFTGIDAPYEPPLHPELTVSATVVLLRS